MDKSRFSSQDASNASHESRKNGPEEKKSPEKSSPEKYGIL